MKVLFQSTVNNPLFFLYLACFSFIFKPGMPSKPESILKDLEARYQKMHNKVKKMLIKEGILES